MLRYRLALLVCASFTLSLLAAAAVDPPETATPPDDLAAEKSVKPGINEKWKGTDADPLVATLEAESREVFLNRASLAALAGPLPGSAVADIGAGSGFMTFLFAEIVGPQGRVYAVDINPVMMGRLARRAEADGHDHVEIVVCGERSVDLPESSVDLVFICDTYHHFEFPRNVLHTIHRALRPGGQIVLVDFHRIPGKTRPFLLEHVRAGESVFAQEIIDAGFELINAHYVPYLEENYVLRFRRLDD